MTLETIVQETIDNINVLSKYVKTHHSSNIDYELMDELETSVADLQEVTYELESRASTEETSDDFEAV
jgi:hypothetical protein